MGRTTRSLAIAAVAALAMTACSSNRELGSESPTDSDPLTTTAPATEVATTDTEVAPETTVPEETTTTATSETTAPETTEVETTTTTAAPPPVYGTPEAPVFVVTGVGVLGWWDGSDWIDIDGDSPDIPVAPGTEFSAFTTGPDTRRAVATGVDVGCEQLGLYTVVLDPPLFFDSDAQNFAVNATWNLFPRPVESLDTTNADYVEIVRQQLVAEGLPDPSIRIDQLLRTDLDGDGSDEVLIAASHPDLDLGVQTRAGWFSIILVRQVDGDGVRTTVLSSDIHVEDGPDEEIPRGAQLGFDAVADFNGDGRAEITTWASFWEGYAQYVYDVAPGTEPREVLAGGCGS